MEHKPKTRHVYVSNEWFESDISEYRNILKGFGLHIYKDNRWDGSTVSGYVLSNEKLDRKQVRAFCNKECPMEKVEKERDESNQRERIYS